MTFQPLLSSVETAGSVARSSAVEGVHHHERGDDEPVQAQDGEPDQLDQPTHQGTWTDRGEPLPNLTVTA